MANLSDRIKSLRLSAEMTQEEFGKKFGIVKSTVSLYESGKSTPNDQIKKQICDYFHVSLDYLLGVDRQGGLDYANFQIDESEFALDFVTAFLCTFIVNFSTNFMNFICDYFHYFYLCSLITS